MKLWSHDRSPSPHHHITSVLESVHPTEHCTAILYVQSSSLMGPDCCATSTCGCTTVWLVKLAEKVLPHLTRLHLTSLPTDGRSQSSCRPLLAYLDCLLVPRASVGCVDVASKAHLVEAAGSHWTWHHECPCTTVRRTPQWFPVRAGACKQGEDTHTTSTEL